MRPKIAAANVDPQAGHRADHPGRIGVVVEDLDTALDRFELYVECLDDPHLGRDIFGQLGEVEAPADQSSMHSSATASSSSAFASRKWPRLVRTSSAASHLRPSSFSALGSANRSRAANAILE